MTLVVEENPLMLEGIGSHFPSVAMPRNLDIFILILRIQFQVFPGFQENILLGTSMQAYMHTN